MKDRLYKERNMVKEFINTLMEMFTLESGLTMSKKVSEECFGRNKNRNIKDFGETIFLMELACNDGMKILVSLKFFQINILDNLK